MTPAGRESPPCARRLPRGFAPGGPHPEPDGSSVSRQLALRPPPTVHRPGTAGRQLAAGARRAAPRRAPGSRPTRMREAAPPGSAPRRGACAVLPCASRAPRDARPLQVPAPTSLACVPRRAAPRRSGAGDGSFLLVRTRQLSPSLGSHRLARGVSGVKREIARDRREGRPKARPRGQLSRRVDSDYCASSKEDTLNLCPRGFHRRWTRGPMAGPLLLHSDREWAPGPSDLGIGH
ncbi:atherin-like [Pteropus medius]|uniref:atherin-like n=1 Tax=Pteropus vampyrus TaxID=132908 RepID=UPI00196B4DEF|nr:atherin-like [Pteropus giganteus]